MEEKSRLEGLDEEKGEEKLQVVLESNDGSDKDVKLIQKIENEANTHDENKKLELMASPNRLRNLSIGKEGSSVDHDINSNASPDQKDDDQEELVECAKAKVGEVREENERLKTLIARAMKKYQSLRTHFLDVLQQQEASKSKDVDQEPEVLVSLSLGRNFSTRDDEPKKEEVIRSSNSSILFKLKGEEDSKEHDHNLALTLDYCKPEVESHDDCDIDEQETKEKVGEPWPPSTKSLNKTVRSHEDDGVSQPALVKKARVSVRARCDAPSMNDGCHWRKYGQKIAKGNPCPRAYYRCTIAPACPVRKQVQRCAEDRSILITTYEGTHNHPLPVAATAMASTTSAAAFMLTSASSDSSSPTFQTSSTTTTSANLHGLNFSNNINPSDNIPNYNSRSSYFFHSSPPNYSSISPSVPNNSHPTITLDLTSTPPSSLLFSNSTSQSNYINKSSSSTFSIPPRTSFSFYSSEPNHHNNISLQPSFWGANGYQNHHHHGYYRYKSNMNPIMDLPEQPLSTETIAAATKAIASDPSFRSALASAITSTIVGADAGAGSTSVLGKNSSAISTTPSGNIIGCASSLLNRSSSSSSSRPDQQFMLLPSSLSFSSPKNKAPTSPTGH